MITIPPRFVRLLTAAVGLHAAFEGTLRLSTPGAALTVAPALVLFAAAFLLVALGGPDRRPSVLAAGAAAAAGSALPLLASIGVDPARASFTTGGWYVEAVASIVILLMWRHREPFAWIVMGVLVAHTAVWGGLETLTTFGIFAAVLLVGIVTAGGWALRRTTGVLEENAETERRTLAFEAAQAAFHAERQVRLATTARLGDAMLQQIVERHGRLDAAGRAECRLLEQTIRDEIRGRRLLNDAVREQVMAHRRRGAIVQVNDDGGLDDLEPDAVDPLLTAAATAMAGLSSDRIIVRTMPSDSPKAISVVAMSSDPVAAALGLDEGDDQVDLWLELDRPTEPAALDPDGSPLSAAIPAP